MLEYAKLAKKYDRPMFLHLRYSSKEKELEGVDEAIRLAKDTGARVHIDHLHSTGGTFHMEQAVEKIRAANAQGLTITTCVYPFLLGHVSFKQPLRSRLARALWSFVQRSPDRWQFRTTDRANLCTLSKSFSARRCSGRHDAFGQDC
jgi:dihydroorotase-like cyclic amidohydrolase